PSYSRLPGLLSFPTRRPSDLRGLAAGSQRPVVAARRVAAGSQRPASAAAWSRRLAGSECRVGAAGSRGVAAGSQCPVAAAVRRRSEEHTSELQSRENLVCRLL